MKKALLVGINYEKTDHKLSGCINDTNNIKDLLVSKFNYNDIKHITDNLIKPTRANIESNLIWLTTNAKAGDTLFFYYSGHGSRITDTNGDEASKLDNCLVPIDYEKFGVITDDWLYINLAKKVPQGVQLWAFTDCCHSGTMLDLKYNITYQCVRKEPIKTKVYNSSEWSNNFGLQTTNANILQGDIFMFSGCLDAQTSADAFINGIYQGAFTFCFLEFLKNNEKNLKNVKIIDALKEIASRLQLNSYKQVSQVSIGNIDDINKTFTF